MSRRAAPRTEPWVLGRMVGNWHKAVKEKNSIWVASSKGHVILIPGWLLLGSQKLMELHASSTQVKLLC